MTEDRVAVVRAFFDAWNRRDLETALEMTGDDFEYVNPPNAVEPGTRRGADGIETVLGKQWEAMGDDARLVIDRMHEKGDWVIAEARLSRGMPESAARLEVKVALRCAFAGERLVGLEVLGAGTTYEEGLARAGVA